MFDWDDSEIASILWDEAAENGDHVVPYNNGSEDCQNPKECKEETTVVKHKEQENPVTKFDLNVKRSESSSTLIEHDRSSASGLGMETWPDLPLSNSSTSEREAISPILSTSLAEIPNYDSERGADQLNKETELYQSNPEAKEQGDFVDYAWANIGSFDDFDRIFSSNDDVFSNSGLSNAEELWPSSRNINNSAVKPFPNSSEFQDLGPQTLPNSSQKLETKTEHVPNDDLSRSLSCGETDNSTSPTLQSGHGILNCMEEQTSVDVGNRTIETTMAAQSAATSSAKVENPKKVTRTRKRTEENFQEKPTRESYGSWSSSISASGQPENRLAHPMTRHYPFPVQQMQFPRPGFFPYQHLPNQFLVRSGYGNLRHPYPAMAVMPHIQPENFKHQQLVPNYNISPANRNPVNPAPQALVKPITMTPQEKIEKLRRRQQQRAMLAIEKQQQRLGQQVTPATIQGLPQKNQSGGDHETDDLSTLNSLDTNSTREQEDDDYSTEESVLHRLQDIVNKLDINVRLSIRDSLFRLARSATQRQNSVDTSCTNKVKKDEQEALAREEINNSFYRLQDSETETNSIDRRVAHLLFHRPYESPIKHCEPSESPRSSKLQSEDKVQLIMTEAEPGQCKGSPCATATSENELSIGLTDGGAVVESSQ